MSTIQEISTMIEKSKRRFLCIKFRSCGLSFSEGIVLLVIGYSKYGNQDTISSLSGIDKYQTAKVLAAMEAVSYTHLDVYKRQPLPMMQARAWWLSSRPIQATESVM